MISQHRLTRPEQLKHHKDKLNYTNQAIMASNFMAAQKLFVILFVAGLMQLGSSSSLADIYTTAADANILSPNSNEGRQKWHFVCQNMALYNALDSELRTAEMNATVLSLCHVWDIVGDETCDSVDEFIETTGTTCPAFLIASDVGPFHKRCQNERDKMGIKQLNTFVENHFTGWRRSELKGKLVVDGHNLKHILNKQDWSHGGQFYQYSQAVEGFFRKLQRSGITPVVVLDGVDAPEKIGTIRKRKVKRIKFIHKSISNPKQRKREISGNSVSPSLAVEVYIQVLIDLRIEFVVVDGEADVEMIEIANHYNCPVLSSDSDFYMHKLEGGYIPMDKLETSTFPVTADVYMYRDFCAEFHFKSESVRLLIPALVGNDTMSPVLHERYKAYIQEHTGTRDVPDHPLGSVMCHIATFDSLDSFMAQISLFDWLSEGSRIKLMENCRISRNTYDSSKTTSIAALLKATGLHTLTGGDVPMWAIENYRKGFFSEFLFSMLTAGRHIFGTFIDDTTLMSSTQASLNIRKHIYGILSRESTFEEYFRDGQTISSRIVTPSGSISDCPLPSLDAVPEMAQSERESLLYAILLCDESVVAKFERSFQLAVATTVFWHRVVQPPDYLVKSLLLCFVMSSCGMVRRDYRNSEAFRCSSEWMSSLHCFSQWQSCYKDAISLNQVLLLPLAVTSPAFLFNGKLVMHLAEPPNLDRALASLRADGVRRYQGLVDAVLSGSCRTSDHMFQCSNPLQGLKSRGHQPEVKSTVKYSQVVYGKQKKDDIPPPVRKQPPVSPLSPNKAQGITPKGTRGRGHSHLAHTPLPPVGSDRERPYRQERKGRDQHRSRGHSQKFQQSYPSMTSAHAVGKGYRGRGAQSRLCKNASFGLGSSTQGEETQGSLNPLGSQAAPSVCQRSLGRGKSLVSESRVASKHPRRISAGAVPIVSTETQNSYSGVVIGRATTKLYEAPPKTDAQGSPNGNGCSLFESRANSAPMLDIDSANFRSVPDSECSSKPRVQSAPACSIGAQISGHFSAPLLTLLPAGSRYSFGLRSTALGRICYNRQTSGCKDFPKEELELQD